MTQLSPVTLADIEEWLCDISKTMPDERSQLKYAEAAQTIHEARDMLSLYAGNSQAVTRLVGREIRAPATMHKTGEMGPPIPKKSSLWRRFLTIR